ncbi:MAG: hypothetical protein AB7P03_20175 [Kofleriaceae bacterium]
MRVGTIVIVATIALAAGCASTTNRASALGPYVRDLRLEPGGIAVYGCRINHSVEIQHGDWFATLFKINTGEVAELTEDGCTRQVVPTQVAR